MIKNTPKHMTIEDLKMLAFDRLYGQENLSTQSVDAFIAGYKECNDVLVHRFGEFLEKEGRYYLEQYEDKRRDACSHAGQPIGQDHISEFEAAKVLGGVLLHAAELIATHGILK